MAQPEPYEYDDDYKLQTENRIKNLMWTVSGNYDLNTKLDIDAFQRSKYIALYDAIKQGAFDKYFDKDALALYLAKKVFLSGDERTLVSIAQLCVDSAVYKKIIEERAGVASIRKQAFEDIADYDFEKLVQTMVGRVKLAMVRETITDDSYQGEKKVNEILKIINHLEDSTDIFPMIRAIDHIYNEYYDRSFEKKHGTLEDVLSVSLDELYEEDWQEFLKDELYQDALEDYLKNLSDSVTSMQDEQEEEEEKVESENSVIYLDEKALERMYSYVELNHGKTYLPEKEEEKINRMMCKGIHADCKLFFTDGILHSGMPVNYQYKYAEKQLEKNKIAYYDHHRVVKRNVSILTDIVKKSLVVRNQIDEIPSDYGSIMPNQLWRVQKQVSGKLFLREIKNENLDFVVDILIDASGSQSARQSKVAMQAYIISEAMSNLGIPHRVMSFCSFWDYTIMRRFRDYDEDREVNMRVFEYSTSSNNRDGLAIKSAVYELSKRSEEQKILIVLSDGKPNDVNINRPDSKNPQPYTGDPAVKDTAYEVRKARGIGISVLGVFAGEEKDFAAERMIFGKDFAYIHNIANFSNVVGLYLRKQIDNL